MENEDGVIPGLIQLAISLITQARLRNHIPNTQSQLFPLVKLEELHLDLWS